MKPFYRTRAHIAIAFASLIFGLNFIIAKSLMPDFIRPLALLFVRSTAGALLFWLVSLFLPREKVIRKDLILIFFYSFFGVVINQMFFLIGLRLTTPIDSSIILSIVPVAAFVFAAIILGEKISVVRASGLVVGLTGVFFLILQEGSPDFGSATFVGNLLTLINSLSWALFTVLIKKILDRYSLVTVMKWVFLFGMIVNVPAGLRQFMATEWSSITISAWFRIIYVVVMSTFVGYVLLTFGLSRLSPTIVNTYNYTQPVVAGVLATMLGQDEVTILKVISAVLIFIGVFLVSRRQKSEPKATSFPST